jgi:hypothetical protein
MARKHKFIHNSDQFKFLGGSNTPYLRKCKKRPTQAPVGQRLCRSAQARFARNGALMIQALPGPQAAGRNDRIQPAGRKNEISCANGGELRDNGFNIGGLAIWDGIERMDGKHQFEAEAIAAVSEPGYFALQRLQNRTFYGPPLSCYEVPRNGNVPRSGMQSAYTIVRAA